MTTAYLNVDISKIKSNLKKIKQGLVDNTKLLLVAKANAYGLGAVPICKEVESIIDYIGVATIAEALELRNENIKTPILLLAEPLPNDFNIVSSFDISVTVYNKSTIKKLDDFALSSNKKIKTHFKIDTGMTRLGSHWKESREILNVWHNTSSNIIKEGVYSHYANSDNKNHPLNKTQLNRFKEHESEFNAPFIHFSNSDAIFNFELNNFNIARVGLAAYDNCFTLAAPLRHIKQIPKDTSVGYGSTYISKEDTQVGIIGMGYADGISTLLSNKGYVIINKHKCPIIGKICMDMFMVKLPNQTFKINDNAIIVSPQNSAGLTIHELAKLTGQNPREIMTLFSSRVIRQY